MALISRHANGDQDLWAPAGVLADLHLEPVDEPRWVANAWPSTSLLADRAVFTEIGEGEADRMKPSIQSSATLYILSPAGDRGHVSERVAPSFA